VVANDLLGLSRQYDCGGEQGDLICGCVNCEAFCALGLVHGEIEDCRKLR
jgi:hypothetical protein